MRILPLEYDQAVKLSSLGFFDWRNILYTLCREQGVNTQDFPNSGPPTVPEALKWCRDTHNLHVSMTFTNGQCVPKVYSLQAGQYKFIYDGVLQASPAYEQSEYLILNWCIEHIAKQLITS